MTSLAILHIYINSYQCLIPKTVNNYISNIGNIFIRRNISKQNMILEETYKKRIDIIKRLATPEEETKWMEEETKWMEKENAWLKNNLKGHNLVGPSTKKGSVVELELQLQQKEKISKWTAIVAKTEANAVAAGMAMLIAVRVVGLAFILFGLWSFVALLFMNLV